MIPIFLHQQARCEFLLTIDQLIYFKFFSVTTNANSRTLNFIFGDKSRTTKLKAVFDVNVIK